MKYQRPMLVELQPAITAIQGGMNKVEDIQDSPSELSNPAYRADE